ncbi:ceramide synthase 4-like [Mytilus galloprovincialis]|uniref:ceramide synthase 4-like n=1 Tax=Mytilus galloprovincialis TaxID=29158 RepID=UPI003F7B4FD8
MRMITWLNHKIDQLLQPELLRPENLGQLHPGDYVPIPSDIVLPSIITAFAFVLIRHIFDRLVVYPIGTYFGLKDSIPRKNTFDHPVLEQEYKNSKSPTSDVILVLSKKTGISERTIQFWFKKRKKQDKVSGIKRLSDSSWSFAFYFVLSWYGIYVLSNKQWSTKTEDCWKGWPLLTVSNDMYYYYLLELGYYISYIYMLFTDHKRKDFLEFLIHHNVTVILLILSWSVNVVRIGALVLCIHDPVDYLLTFAKSAVYCKKHRVADICFVVFLFLWILTRLIVYPYVVLYSVYIELPTLAENDINIKTLDSSLVIQFLKALLVVLQVLHVLWTILIFKSAATKFTRGELQDARSDSEDDEKDDDDDDVLNDENFKEMFNNNTGNNGIGH